MSEETIPEEVLFLAALELEVPEERLAYIDSACRGRSDLRARVLELLEFHAETQGVFDVPPSGLALDPLLPPQDTEVLGTMIGAYTVREVLGEGGMGIVYAATQERPLRRKVAIKVIKPGMDSKEVIGRFEAERQALALMDHPNIAKVYHAGTTESGRPYFVMELVRGMPITDYCDRATVNLQKRLELFIQVCQAIQHAHQKGVIHRDLKPSNVLVTLHDGVPVPKVIDFGVAKAMNQRLTEHTVYTQNAQMLGTPMYMSPEQAELSGLDVDTRSDVYSLGVLLYELLAGVAPFDKDRFARVSHDEMRRMIRKDEPPRPSQRVSTLEAKVLSTVSGKRGLDERKFTKYLRGELDWIVMKALEKDRQRRYESASAFAAEVQHFLDDEPVAACPPSTAYRLRKFARRNKATLVTAIIVSAALVLGTGVSIWQAFEATSARKLADERLGLANERLKNETLAKTDADNQRRLAADNLQKAMEAVEQMLLRVADERLAAIPGTEPVRQELFQEALRFYDDFLRQTPEDPTSRVGIAKVWTQVAKLHDYRSDPEKAQEARLMAIQQWGSLHTEDSGNLQIQLALAETLMESGSTEHWLRYQFPYAESAYRRALALYQDLERRFPDNTDYSWRASGVEASLGDLVKATGRLELGESLLRHAVNVERALWSRKDVSHHGHNPCRSLFLLTYFLREDRKYDPEREQILKEAIQYAEEIRSNDPTSLGGVYAMSEASLMYGNFFEVKGEFDEAERWFRRGLDAGSQLARANPRAFNHFFRLTECQIGLGRMLERNGRYLEALKYYHECGDLMRSATLLPKTFWRWNNTLGAANDGLRNCLKNLVQSGRTDEARSFCNQLSHARGHDALGILSVGLAMTAWETIGEPNRSHELKTELIDQLKKLNPKSGDPRERGEIFKAVFSVADREFHLSHYDEALPLLDQAIRWNTHDSETRDHRGQIYLERGENEEALADLDVAIELGPKYGADTYHKRASAHFRLGKYSRALADLTRAFQMSPAHPNHLNAIDPEEIASCPDETFQKDYFAWFQQALSSVTPSPEARLDAAALRSLLHQPDAAEFDLVNVAADATALPRTLSQAALLALRSGNQSYYRKISTMLVSRDSKSLNQDQRWYISWTAALAPDALDDYESAVSVARELLALDPLDPGALLELGSVLFRAGEFEEALDCLTRSENSQTKFKHLPEYGQFFLAMAHQKLGHDPEARQWYEKALASTEKRLAERKCDNGQPLRWYRLATLELLRAETTVLFEESPNGEKLRNRRR